MYKKVHHKKYQDAISKRRWSNHKNTCICTGKYTNVNKQQYFKTTKHVVFVKAERDWLCQQKLDVLNVQQQIERDKKLVQKMTNDIDAAIEQRRWPRKPIGAKTGSVLPKYSAAITDLFG